MQKVVEYSFPTTLVAPIADDAVTAKIVHSGAPYTPTLGAGEYCYAMFCSDEYFVDTGVPYETVKVTAIVPDGSEFEITMVRDQESTDGPKAWPAGTFVMFGHTAIGQQEILDDVDDHIANTIDAHGVDDYLPKAGGTMSGELNLADNLLTRPKIKDYGEAAVIATGVSGSTTINLENGNVVQHTLSGAVSYTVSNPSASGIACSFTLIIIQPATAVSVTWHSGVRWVNGAPPDLAVDSGIFVLTFSTLDAGTTWYGFLSGSDMKKAS